MSEKPGLNQVENVLFDFDGTLVDSREAVLRTFSEFAATFGVNATKQVIARFDGLTTYEIVATAKREWNIRGTVDELTEQYFRLLAATYEQVAEHPGAFTALKALETRGRRLGLVTSAPQQLVEPVLERLGWPHLFGCKIYGKPGIFGKPHPALYMAALSALGADPANVIAVEDSVSGVRSATAAGIRVVAVASALMHIRLKEAGAILVVDNLEALLRVLER
jgi:HAD superfamily hydrolase (TIGR01509 family)